MGMRYDVFISYAHGNGEDANLRNALRDLLKGWRLDVFVDEDEIVLGTRWAAYIQETLSDVSGTIVVVLGTRVLKKELAAEPEHWVRKEVARAKAQGLTVILLSFVPGIAELLGTGDLQYLPVDTSRCSDVDALGLKEVQVKLRRDLHHKLRREFEGFRREAETWTRSRLDPVRSRDFWGEAWRTVFDVAANESAGDSLHVALIAEGGSGKTVCLAHFLEDLLQRDGQLKYHPVLVGATKLREGPQGICALLRASTVAGLSESSERFHFHGERILFIVDGLDTVGFATDQILENIKAAIELLRRHGWLIITCRPEVWAEGYGYLNIHTRELDLLPPKAIENWLLGFQPTDTQRDFLRRPLFLDYALRVRDSGRDLPETTWHFLFEIYLLASEQTMAVPTPRQTSSVLHSLALTQLRLMKFAVPRKTVIQEAHLSLSEAEAALDAIRKAGLLREEHDKLRLSHDLFDCYGMACQLLGTEDSRRELYKRLNGDCGWQVASMLLLASCESAPDTSLRTEIMRAFLRILDYKRCAPDNMARAWGRNICPAGTHTRTVEHDCRVFGSGPRS